MSGIWAVGTGITANSLYSTLATLATTLGDIVKTTVQTLLLACPVLRMLSETIARERMPKPEASPVKPNPTLVRFIFEQCSRRPGLRVKVPDLAAAASMWYAQNMPGLQAPSASTIGKELKLIAPEVKIRRHHAAGRFYENLGLTSKAPA